MPFPIFEDRRLLIYLLATKTIAEVFGLQAYASVNGFIYFVRGLGAMFGYVNELLSELASLSQSSNANHETPRSPIGGKIVGENKVANYGNVAWFDGALLAGAAFCVLGVRGWDALEKGGWRWRA